MKLEGMVAIVAGGGQGIGEGIVRCLAEEGADVAVADINPDTAGRVADEVKSMGRKALPVVADLTEEGGATRSVQETVDFFGKVDILINNVGGSSEQARQLAQESRESLEDQSLPAFMHNSSKVWDNFYELNLRSHVLMSQAVTPYFVKQRSGKIVNISSIAGRGPAGGLMPYGSMKAADISLTWSLASALAPYDVNVNCICPGWVYTPLWERGATAQYDALREAKAQGRTLPPPLANQDIEAMTAKDLWRKYTVNSPLGREQTAEDMGLAVVFLVSEDAKNITGQTLHVDGGATMR